MKDLAILTAMDGKGDSFFAATYDGTEGQMVGLVGPDGTMSEAFRDTIPVESVVLTTSSPVQFVTAEEVMHLANWFERAAMWLAMREEMND